VMTRQARHDAMDHVKKLEGISEDETERLEKEVQKTIDSTMSTIDGMGKQKEDELLQI
jgi:ribosome recycling factor